MAIPKSIVRINKDGIKFVDNLDRTQYTVHELIRAALKDSAKIVVKRSKDNYKRSFKVRTGRGLKAVQSWVRASQDIPDLQIGIKSSGFYMSYFELGANEVIKETRALTTAAKESVPDIIALTNIYLNKVNDDNLFLDEEEYIGDDS